MVLFLSLCGVVAFTPSSLSACTTKGILDSSMITPTDKSPTLKRKYLSTLILNAIRDDGSIQSESLQRRPFLSPIRTFSSLVECLDAMDYNEGDPEYTVILYFAHYCKLCHQANIPYKRLAYGADPKKIQFTRLETSIITVPQFQSLGISRVPFIQIYRHGVCVASFNTKWQLENKLKETLEVCQYRSMMEWDVFMRKFEVEINMNKVVRRRLREETLLPISSGLVTTGNIQTLASETQLLNAIDRTEGGPMAVVMFHSHFVPACSKSQHAYRRIAESSMGSDTLFFARIEVSVLSEVFLQALDIKKYPHIQIYKDGKCVASFSIPQIYVFRLKVRNAIDEAKRRQPNDWEIFHRQYADEIAKNHNAIKTIRSEQLRA